MMWSCVSSYARSFVVRCMGGWVPLGSYGLGWVMGPEVHLEGGWVGLGQLQYTSACDGAEQNVVSPEHGGDVND